MTRTRTAPNVPGFPTLNNNPKPSSPPSDRFIRLDNSPEREQHNSFDSPPSGDQSFSASETANGSEQPLFPSNSTSDAAGRAPSLIASDYNAISIHIPVGHTNMNQNQTTAGAQFPFPLDPSILQLPLGTLLNTPAGAQLLANLGNIGLMAQNLTGGGNQNNSNASAGVSGGQEQFTGSGPTLPGKTPPMGDFLDLNSVEDDSMTLGQMDPQAKQQSPLDVNQLRWDPSLDISQDAPSSQLNAPGISQEGADAHNNPPFHLGLASPGTIDWNDPAVAALWSQMNAHDHAVGGEDAYVPSVAGFENYLDQSGGGGEAELGDAVDFDQMFDGGVDGNGKGNTGDGVSGGGGESSDVVEGMPGPVQKKRKTDQR